MKLSIRIVAVLTLCCIAGCKKSNSTSANSPGALPSIVTTGSGSAATTDTYTYDSQNRLVEEVNSAYKEDIKYKYDNNNRLIEFDLTDATGYSETALYDYGTAGVVKGNYTNISSGVKSTSATTYTLNGSQQVIRIDATNTYNLYTYDSAGNATAENDYLNGSQIYAVASTYDQNISPFKNVIGNLPQLHLLPSTNNTIKQTVTKIAPTYSTTDTYQNTYQFNAAGYAISVTSTHSTSSSSVVTTSTETIAYIIQ